MSRRRDPEDAPGSSDQSSTFRFVCTGRRRHKTVSFGIVVFWPGDGADIELDAEDFAVEANGPGFSHETFTMTCRRCRPVRTVPLTRSSIEKLCRGLAGRDTRVDISALGAVGPISS